MNNPNGTPARYEWERKNNKTLSLEIWLGRGCMGNPGLGGLK